MSEYSHIRWKTKKALPGRDRDWDQVWDVAEQKKRGVELLMTRSNESTVTATCVRNEDDTKTVTTVDLPWVDVDHAVVRSVAATPTKRTRGRKPKGAAA